MLFITYMFVCVLVHKGIYIYTNVATINLFKHTYIWAFISWVAQICYKKIVKK